MTPQELETQLVMAFIKHHNITNDQGDPLDFKDHMYLWDIYNDLSPNQAILKAAQIGFSTMANIKALWLAKNKKMDIIYSLPSVSDIHGFVSGKTNRLIANNPIFQEWTADKDSIEQKSVGKNVIYFKGTWTDRAAIATPADLYISDETDRSKQEIVALFQSRLQHSSFGWRWYFSNPSVPGAGVDKYWQESDQMHWFIKCQHCNHEWYLDMNNLMGQETGKPYFGCTKCKKELDRRSGRWVPKKQNRDFRGYWIPLLISPKITAKYVVDKQRSQSEEQFTNFVLGLPYVGKGNVLTRQMFLQNLTNEVNPRDARTVLGVDTGVGINMVAVNKYGTFYYDKFEDYDPIDKWLQREPTAICIIDQGGDIIGPRKLREKYPGRVFLCFFRQSQKNDKLVTWNDDDGTVTADRDRLLQLVVDEFIEKRMPVYGTENDWYDYMTEWLGMYRTTEETPLGIKKYHWNKPSTGRCDYPFAQVYARIGLGRFLEESATFHDPSKDSFAFRGIEALPDGRMFNPKSYE